MSEAPKKIPRPQPKINAFMETKPFWDAAKQNKLVIQYCKDTGKAQFFPHPVSMATGRRNLEWREVSGKGQVYSWTVTNSPWPGHEDRVPFLCALVELDEGVRMLTNIVECKPEEVKVGMPVEVTFEDATPEISIPVFRPAAR